MTRMSLLGRTAVASLAVGVTLVVAGCGNQNTADDQHSSGASGSTSSSGSSSATSSGGTSYAGKALTKNDIMQVTYAAAQKAGTAHMAMSVTGKAAMTANGDVAYEQGSPRMSMTMSMAQLGKAKIAMRYVDKVLYMQIPGLSQPGKFVSIDPSDKSSALAKSFASTTDQMDPLQSIKAMESAVRSSERVGKGTMDGVTVEHYKLTVDTRSLVKGISAQQLAQADVPKTITYDLWLDEQHLLRRTSFDMMGTHFVATMSKWGEPVKIEAPAAGQIQAMPGS